MKSKMRKDKEVEQFRKILDENRRNMENSFKKFNESLNSLRKTQEKLGKLFL